ncbi:MAG TPA: aspartate carbamoyltransferase [Thermomicrobiaceae bacterium]|nr:aspartate carbamoyltransferase [Thermomicrobiaceae bacterium]
MPDPRSVLGVRQFDREYLEEIFRRADEMRAVVASGGSSRLRGRIMATLFFEPSTRTRLSFESAMARLGGAVLSAEYARETSSAAKGETVEDTARIVESYADVIVIRHPDGGSAARAAAVVDVPVINAGDGPYEHPTQALLDLYTIRSELGRIDNLRLALVGDLKYGRAPRSLALLALQTRGNELIFVAPPNVRMGDDVKHTLTGAGVAYREESDLRSVLPEVDIVYQTRIQHERFASEADYEAARGRYIIDPDAMRLLRSEAILMHPLPRVDEIASDVDQDPRAVYFSQARNGVFVRMALLDLLLGNGI